LLQSGKKDVDGRDICAETRFALLPGHDGSGLERVKKTDQVAGVAMGATARLY
jgi:hypothetical protein